MSPLRRLASIVDLGVRVRGVKERLDGLGEAAFAAALDALARDAARGANPSDEAAMLACALYFLRHGEAQVEALRGAAEREGHRVAASLLAEAPARKALTPLGRPRDPGGPRKIARTFDMLYVPPTQEEIDEYEKDPNLALVREVFPDWPGLGGDGPRRWMRYPLTPAGVARQVHRMSEKIEPSVVPAFLRDPAADLRSVLKIASRRPTTPEIVEALVAHDRWIARSEVRAALVENPFTPTRMALLFVPTVRGRLRGIGRRDLHPRVIELVGMLGEAGA
jgi:hypothetical protein